MTLHMGFLERRSIHLILRGDFCFQLSGRSIFLNLACRFPGSFGVSLHPFDIAA
jgi:hypothetical protein